MLTCEYQKDPTVFHPGGQTAVESLGMRTPSPEEVEGKKNPKQGLGPDHFPGKFYKGSIMSECF